MPIVTAFEWRCADGTAPEIVPGTFVRDPWKLCADAPFEEGRLLNFFPETPPDDEKNPLFYSLTETGDNEYRIAALENGKKYLMNFGEKPEGEFTLSGLAPELRPIQPNIFKLSEHSYRMYFWAHYHGTPRQVRMLIAESSDLHHWKIINNARPVLYHYSDKDAAAGLVPARCQCNDATAIYHRPDGSWEFLSAALVRLSDAERGRYFKLDLWHGYVRIIQRWVGDGENFTEMPEIVAAPDENDSLETQFYYLTATDVPGGNFGLLGHYDASAQLMYPEPVWSFDRRHWMRCCRNTLLFQDDGLLVSPAQRMVARGEDYLLYYNYSNHNHSFQAGNGIKPVSEIHAARISRHALFGIRLPQTGTVCSPMLRLNETLSMRLYTTPETLKAIRWKNFCGNENSALRMKAVPENPACVKITIENGKPGEIGFLEIAGNGVVYNLELCAEMK